MKTQTAHGGFPQALLTSSVVLLVLAIGFIVGRVVVARAYLSSAPKVEAQSPGGSELDEDRPAPGHVDVPTPKASPPLESTDEGQNLSGAPQEPTPDEATRQGTAGPQTSGPAKPEGQEQKQPAPQPVQETKPPGESGNKTYSIQVGVFSSLQGARQQMDELTRAGYPARVARDQRAGQDLYRVVTGRYRSDYAARKALEQLRTEGFEAFLIEQ